MRVIGGILGGRIFHPPLSRWPTRPTTDRAREALFNILTNRFDFNTMSSLDLFAGTGANSLEALSRGCSDVTYVDKFRPAFSWFRKIVQELELQDHCTLYLTDVRKFIERSDRSYICVFADPPYDLPWLKEIPELLFQHDLLEEGGSLIIEHGKDIEFSDHDRFERVRSYGQTRFSFFQ